MPTDLEMSLALQLRLLGLPEPVHQHRFCERRWRFDLCWQAQRLAVEIDGGTWQYGRHNRPEGYEADCEKQAEAVVLGWRVMKVTGDMVRDGRAATLIKRALHAADAGEETQQ